MNAFSTLIKIAKSNFKKLIFTFSLVLAENLLWLLYPLIMGYAINQILAGNVILALGYAFVVLAMWLVGAFRRKIDTMVFAKMYAKLALNVVKNERAAANIHSKTTARVTLSREFIDFFEEHFPMAFSSLFSIIGAAFMLFVLEIWVGVTAIFLLFLIVLLLRPYILRNDRLFFALNNRLEKENALIKDASFHTLSRHFDLAARFRIALSSREALAFGVVGVFASIVFAVAIVVMSRDLSDAGHIYSVLSYIFTLSFSLEWAPHLIEQFSKLKDIGKRVNAS